MVLGWLASTESTYMMYNQTPPLILLISVNPRHRHRPMGLTTGLQTPMNSLWRTFTTLEPGLKDVPGAFRAVCTPIKPMGYGPDRLLLMGRAIVSPGLP